MKSLTKLTFGTCLALMLAASGCDVAGISPTEFRSQVAGYEIDLVTAMDLAAAAAGGVVVDAEYDDGRWEVEAVVGASRVRVAVDPQTGGTKVLSTRPADAEELAAIELLQTAPSGLAEAITAAGEAVSGGLPYEIEVEEGVYEVAVVNGSGFFEVEISPFGGDVLEVEEDEDEDPELDDDSDDDVEDEDEDEDDGENNDQDEDDGENNDQDEDDGQVGEDSP